MCFFMMFNILICLHWCMFCFCYLLHWVCFIFFADFISISADFGVCLWRSPRQPQHEVARRALHEVAQSCQKLHEVQRAENEDNGIHTDSTWPSTKKQLKSMKIIENSKKNAKSWNAVRIGEKTIILEQIIKIHKYSVEDE